MAQQIMLNQEDPIEALQLLISRTGFDPADFEIDEHKSGEYIDTAGNRAQMLTLRRRGTAKQCTYEVAKDSPWLFSPFADLTSGKYGSPLRSPLIS
jgi:hypothetical protein